MTGDEGLFASLDHYDNPTETIIYGDNGQGDVIGLGKIAISTTNLIEDVYHVQGLGYNLLSVSQLCEKGYNCLFTHEGVTVVRDSPEGPLKQPGESCLKPANEAPLT
jgi:hypothetical protein